MGDEDSHDDIQLTEVTTKYRIPVTELHNVIKEKHRNDGFLKEYWVSVPYQFMRSLCCQRVQIWREFALANASYVIYSQNAIFEHAKIDIEATINGTISNVRIAQQIYFE